MHVRATIHKYLIIEHNRGSVNQSHQPNKLHVVFTIVVAKPENFVCNYLISHSQKFSLTLVPEFFTNIKAGFVYFCFKIDKAAVWYWSKTQDLPRCQLPINAKISRDV